MYKNQQVNWIDGNYSIAEGIVLFNGVTERKLKNYMVHVRMRLLVVSL